MKKSGVAAIAGLVVLIIIGVIYWQTRPETSSSASSNTTNGGPGSTPSAGAASPTGPTGSKPKTHAPAPKHTHPDRAAVLAYCSQPGDDRSARAPDAKILAGHGGLVAIFENEAAVHDVYACGQRYLQAGGDIDAVDPRQDSDHLTPLLFAIHRNDPKMVHFVLDHGANPSKRGGPQQVKPYGYAVFLALKNQATNYNEVIGILDTALRQKDSAAKEGDQNAAKDKTDATSTTATSGA